MLLCSVNFGFLFYDEIKRREKVIFNEEYRSKVLRIFEEMHMYYEKGHTPKVKTSKACNACSLKEHCMPKLCGNLSAQSYIKRMVNE